ncbi:MAG: matrixin family metalloprotease [Patescibacteria group bacterium]
MKTTMIAPFALFAVFVGCVDVDDAGQPFVYYLSDSWSGPEAEVIREAARTWERMTCLTLFEDGGWAPHDGGWTVEKEYDDKNVVYPFSAIDSTPDIDDALARNGGFAGLYAGDILLMRSANLRFVRGQVCFYDGSGNELRCLSVEEATADFVFQFNLDQLKMIAIHEFGHALGLRHNDLEPSVMGSGNAPEEFFSREPTAGDIRNVCREHPCPAECPTRP